MATLPIFPSISRAPSMDSSEQVEDDTIRDQMELGYTATRPRFTRARRSWNFNLRTLTAEDVRAIRHFRDKIVQRGAMPFRYPNLLFNGSFELQASDGSSDVAQGWASDGGTVTASVAAEAYDGFSSLALTAKSASVGGVTHFRTWTTNAGDVFAFAAMCRVDSGSASGALLAVISLTYDDESTATLSASVAAPAVGAGWQLVGAAFSPVASTSGGSASAVASFALKLNSPVPSTVYIDSAGVGLVTAGRPSTQMAGSEPIAAMVRFADSGLPKFSDLGWINGQKRYGATMTLGEV